MSGGQQSSTDPFLPRRNAACQYIAPQNYEAKAKFEAGGLPLFPVLVTPLPLNPEPPPPPPNGRQEDSGLCEHSLQQEKNHKTYISPIGGTRSKTTLLAIPSQTKE